MLDLSLDLPYYDEDDEEDDNDDLFAGQHYSDTAPPSCKAKSRPSTG